MTNSLDRTLLAVSDYVTAVFRREATAAREGFLQSVAPAVALLGTLLLLVVVATLRTVRPLLVIGGVAVALAVTSAVSLRAVGRVVGPVAVLACVVVAPQAVTTPGQSLVGPVTVPGASAVAVLTLRASVSAALVALLTATTRFSALLAGLERLRVPSTAVQLLAVTRRYLLTSVATLARRVRSRRARNIGRRPLRARWRSFGRLLARCFRDALAQGRRVHRSARARGGPGPLRDRRPRPLDVADALFVAVVCCTALAGWLL